MKFLKYSTREGLFKQHAEKFCKLNWKKNGGGGPTTKEKKRLVSKQISNSEGKFTAAAARRV